jgi:hypothetical protein
MAKRDSPVDTDTRLLVVRNKITKEIMKREEEVRNEGAKLKISRLILTGFPTTM